MPYSTKSILVYAYILMSRFNNQGFLSEGFENWGIFRMWPVFVLELRCGLRCASRIHALLRKAFGQMPWAAIT
jgi:hypothetical protein